MMFMESIAGINYENEDSFNYDPVLMYIVHVQCRVFRIQKYAYSNYMYMYMYVYVYVYVYM